MESNYKVGTVKFERRLLAVSSQDTVSISNFMGPIQ